MRINHIFYQLRLTSGEGFDQFGSLFGQVSINDDISKEIIELNLPGVRMVRDVKDDQRTMNDSLKTWTLVGTCKDGFVLTLSAKEIGNQPKVYMGAVRKPNMNVFSIEATDFNFNKLENEITEIPFKLKGKSMKKLLALEKIHIFKTEVIKSLNFISVDNEKLQGILHNLMLPKKIMENCSTIKFQQYISFGRYLFEAFSTHFTELMKIK